MPASTSNITGRLKKEALRLGFDACGVSRAESLDVEAERLRTWLNSGMHGTMSWMENHLSKRIDPRILVPGAQSIVSVLQNYYQPVSLSDAPEKGRISRYALGDDYHDVMRERLHELIEWLRKEAPDVEGRVFVDSAPVMDKAWAARAGLGWLGKHSNLINSRIGSWFFIGELIVNTELTPDSPITDMCGTCTRCIEACPTDAITDPYVVDASRCISYLTIEHREDDIDDELSRQTGNWIFGCDICQDVCPWNKFQTPSAEPSYVPRDGILNTDLTDWAALTSEEFQRRFRKSPIKRAQQDGFSRNIRNAQRNAERASGQND